MCREQGVFQKLSRIVELGPRQALEIQRHRLQCQLGRDFAFGVAAHAVGHDEQTGFLGIAIPHPVFVPFAAAFAAELEDRKLHLVGPPPTRFLVSLTSESIDIRTFSETLSLV